MAEVVFLCNPIDKPVLGHPPQGWEDAIVPSGTLFPNYRREAYVRTQYGKSYLMWYRAYYWLPRQKINLELLTDDNDWVVMDTIEGPSVYIALPSRDGQPTVMRCVAA